MARPAGPRRTTPASDGPRQQFEAVIWQQLGAYATTRIVDTILAAADSYALAEYGITADRRAALENAIAAGLRTVHFRVPCAVTHDSCAAHARACNSCCWKSAPGVLATTVTGDVTCQKCLRSLPYLEASAGGMEPGQPMAPRPALTAHPMHYIPLDGRQDEFACDPDGAATGTTELAAVTCRQCLSTDTCQNDLALTGQTS